MCPIHHTKSTSKQSRASLRLATHRLRSHIWIPGEETPISGFSFVADFSETGVGLYLAEKIKKGTALRVAFGAEDSESYRGNVIWCNRYTMKQGFVGHNALNYRLGIKLLFGSEAERQRYVKFVKSIREKTLELKVGMIF